MLVNTGKLIDYRRSSRINESSDHLYFARMKELLKEQRKSMNFILVYSHN